MIPVPTLPAAVELAFDPILLVGDQGVRIETLALGAVILVALLLLARIATVTPVNPARPPNAPGAASDEVNHLRADDLLYIAIAVLPGAVAGGRLGHVLAHADFYLANPGAIVDPGTGGLTLPLAIVGGTLTGAFVTGLLGAPVGRWLHAAAVPLLFALSAGKAVLVLGGDGQGLPADLPWATAYTGPGPWGSLAPEVPSHPAQAYEAILVALALGAVAAILAGGGFRALDGRAFALAIGLWAAARFVVAFTWRDAEVLGPLRAEHLLAAALGLAAAAAYALLAARERRGAARGGPAGTTAGATPGEPTWPDPASRPRF